MAVSNTTKEFLKENITMMHTHLRMPEISNLNIVYYNSPRGRVISGYRCGRYGLCRLRMAFFIVRHYQNTSLVIGILMKSKFFMSLSVKNKPKQKSDKFTLWPFCTGMVVPLICSVQRHLAGPKTWSLCSVTRRCQLALHSAQYEYQHEKTNRRCCFAIRCKQPNGTLWKWKGFVMVKWLRFNETKSLVPI